MALPTTLVRWFASSLSAFDDAPLHNDIKRVDLSLSDLLSDHNENRSRATKARSSVVELTRVFFKELRGLESTAHNQRDASGEGRQLLSIESLMVLNPHRSKTPGRARYFFSGSQE
jgi:hypothetical protein